MIAESWRETGVECECGRTVVDYNKQRKGCVFCSWNTLCVWLVSKSMGAFSMTVWTVRRILEIVRLKNFGNHYAIALESIGTFMV